MSFRSRTSSTLRFSLPIWASLTFVAVGGQASTILDVNALGLSIGESVEGKTFQGAKFTSETGTLAYENGGGIPSFMGFSRAPGGGDADIYVSFAFPVAAVSVTMGDGGCSGCDQDAFRVQAFDFDTHALLATTDSPLFGGNGLGSNDVFTLSIPGTNIGRLIIDPGNSGVLPGQAFQAGGVLLSRLEFTPITVPEPATGFLAALGVAIAAAVRKARSSAWACVARKAVTPPGPRPRR